MSSSPAPLESAAVTDSRLAALCAQEAQQAFEKFQTRFHAITRRARERFFARDWSASYADATERLHLYSNVINDLVSQIRDLMASRVSDRTVWAAIKAVYSSLIAHSWAWEIAESFFNSLTRRIFATDGVDQAIEFVDTDFDAPPAASPVEVRRIHSGAKLSDLLYCAVTDPEVGGFPQECWADLPGDTELAAERIIAAFPRGISRRNKSATATTFSLEMIAAVFYRGRGAYLVGRAIVDDATLPLALCLRHESAGGITLDAVLRGEADLSILFSYTRAYFRVEAVCPYKLVRYLRQLMPRKRLADLYNAIGYNRHAKTEFYRDFVAHLRASQDCFTTAEGARGMVMLVFTLPSYDVVFKLIKDRFDYPKESSRPDVMSICASRAIGLTLRCWTTCDAKRPEQSELKIMT